MSLSKNGEMYLESLAIHLKTSGKSEAEADEFLKEAKAHLLDGEKDGKTAESIFGASPKEYAEIISKELSVNTAEITRLLLTFFIGGAAFILLSLAVHQQLAFNLYGLAGFSILIPASLAGAIFLIRKIAGKRGKKFFFMPYVFGILQIGCFVAVILLNQFAGKPIFVVTGTLRWVIISGCFAILIWFNISSKTKYLILVPILLYVPTIVAELLSFDKTAAFVISMIFILAAAFYSILMYRKELKKEA